MKRKFKFLSHINPITGKKYIDTGPYPVSGKCPKCGSKNISCSFNVGHDCECHNYGKEF